MQSSAGYMRALAFVYDNLDNFPAWVRKLAPGQLIQLAEIMRHFAASGLPSSRIIPLEETQKREVIRAIIAYQGDLRAVAKALGIGKTTIYRLLHKWGLSRADWRLVVQARVLAENLPSPGTQKSNALTAALDATLSTSLSLVSGETSTSTHHRNAERRK
jgi:hypothetical protein